MSKVRALLFLALWTFFVHRGYAENTGGTIIIIANPSVPAVSVSLKQLAAIYLLRVTLWPDGQPIVPVNQEADSRLRALFSERVLGQRPIVLANYWNQMHFQGKNPPLVMDSDQAVTAFVRKVSGAIGYVSANTPMQGVRIVGRLP
ncbi:MAG: substrate-binding domain-containing protein [Sulfuricella sp.]